MGGADGVPGRRGEFMRCVALYLECALGRSTGGRKGGVALGRGETGKEAEMIARIHEGLYLFVWARSSPLNRLHEQTFAIFHRLAGTESALHSVCMESLNRNLESTTGETTTLVAANRKA